MSNIKKLYLEKQESTFATNLQRLMMQHQISEAELARQTSIPQPTLHKILTGKTADPRATTLLTLASHFNISIDQLLTGVAPEVNAVAKEETQSIPVISWKQCVDYTQVIPELKPSSWPQWTVVEFLDPLAFALVSKPSMEARMPKGSLLIVDPTAEAEDGDLLVVHYAQTNEATIRELSIEGPNRALYPIDPAGSLEAYPESLDVLGVVVQSRFMYSKD